MTATAKHLLISGRVQGVCFRASTRQEATRLGLTGWVRNLPDGRVEAVAQGPAGVVQKLVDWCWHGVQFAKVTDLIEEDTSVDPILVGYEVRY